MAGSILPLQLDGVGFATNGQRLLDGVSLRLETGSRSVILGPNGAGKSLLMRLCHGLLRPSAGSIRWGNGAGAPPPETLRRRQAMVFQKPVMLRRSAMGNVTYALAASGVPWRGRRRLAEKAIETFGLLPIARRPARLLSGGEQQRLALARAWATRPEVLFLDEPTASLDPAATRAFEAALEAFRAEGTKVVMATHDLGQARRLADEIFFLCQGRLVEQGPANAFFAAPQSAEARAFLAGEIVG
jgi:tungstate transport system ATP-binding protein